MKAMILCAGKGTRVKPITDRVPKPMIPLVTRPVLEFIVRHLQSQGVDDLVINTSHLADQVHHYFGDGDRFGVRIAYSFEGELVDGELLGQALGSAGGMRKVQDFSGFFDQTFLVLCGDALIDLNVVQAMRFHRERRALATIVLKEVPRSEVFRYGVVKTNEFGCVHSFQEKPAAAAALSTMVNTGIYIFEPEVFEHIPAGVQYDIGGQLFPALVAKGEPVYGFAPPMQWVDIGCVADYWTATRMALLGEIPGFRPAGHRIAPGIVVGNNVRIDLERTRLHPPVYIGGSACIGADATIVGPTVIGANSVIEPGATIRECIIGENVRVSAGARLERKIIHGSHCIDPGAGYLDLHEWDLGWLIGDARARPVTNEPQALLKHLTATAATR